MACDGVVEDAYAVVGREGELEVGLDVHVEEEEEEEEEEDVEEEEEGGASVSHM